MKKKIAGAVLLLSALISLYIYRGKTIEIKVVPKMAAPISEEAEFFEKKYSSSVEAENCFVCGYLENSLIPYYAKRDSIGIIHWNSQWVSDTGVRAYGDDGKELFGNESMSLMANSFGDGYGSVYIQEMANRGISELSAYFSDTDCVYFEKLSGLLCQNCLDKVAEFYCDQKESGNSSYIGTTGFSLIDFQTRELYPLSDPYRGYMIRDYYIQYDFQNNEDESYIDLTIFYEPERKEN